MEYQIHFHRGVTTTQAHDYIEKLGEGRARNVRMVKLRDVHAWAEISHVIGLTEVKDEFVQSISKSELGLI